MIKKVSKYGPAVFIGCALLLRAQSSDLPKTAATQASTLDIRDRNLYVGPVADSRPLMRRGLTNVMLDQRDIWTSPFHMHRSDLKYLALFGAGTAALIATDHLISKQLPASGTAVDVGRQISRAGQYYSVYPFSASLFLIGAGKDDDHLKNTGALGVQALVDVDIVFNVFKLISERQRPLAGDTGGHFEKGGGSFPSGHAAQAWAIASVVAHEYPERKWVPILAYSYATAVSVSRVSAREHFPSDIFIGSALGYFVGRYVVNSDKQHLAHVGRLGAMLFHTARPAPLLAAGPQSVDRKLGEPLPD